MASIFSRIFSIFSGSAASVKGEQAPLADPQTYKDCTIHALPQREGSQYRLAGRIEKTIDGEVLERNFIRADVFTSLDDALDCTFRKARQIIDQNGPSLFGDGEKSRIV
ncbi:transcriptional activator HlyU [Peteryoungia desertarenae]|uniref:Transcriptional activator HlyU n=1 Tax=Peteryoungia desertarenae TaxID=1813451 RepID=A0ABX6QP18_9HYPH|nr:HlyU family transcriptional regulator [Peteryoungia desertarenae]QLF70263.1 transcriptional activator HlyU [Peteryoungia desertarenae]